MIKIYKVTFRYSENVWCTNLAKAFCIEQVETAYSKYSQVIIREAQDWEIREAIAKGMPMIDCEQYDLS